MIDEKLLWKQLNEAIEWMQKEVRDGGREERECVIVFDTESSSDMYFRGWLAEFCPIYGDGFWISSNYLWDDDWFVEPYYKDNEEWRWHDEIERFQDKYGSSQYSTDDGIVTTLDSEDIINCACEFLRGLNNV